MTTTRLLFAALTAMAATTVPAQDAPTRFPAAQGFDTAVQLLNARIDNRAPNTPLPRTSDPAIARAITTVADESGSFGTAAFPVRGIVTYQPVCGAVQGIAMKYALFGLDRPAAGAARDPARDQAELARVMTANTRAYQNEIFPLMRFSVRCNALHVPALEDMAARLGPEGMTPERRDGLTRFRGGLVQMVEGALQMMAQGAVQPAHRVAILKQIARDAPSLTRVMTLAQRAALAGRAARYAPAVPAAAKGDFDRLLAALADRRCEGLCAIA